MILTFISWIVIFFVLFSIGDIFISFYNKLCSENQENYNIVDTTLLGMCAILIPISIISLWLPTNHYILLVIVIVCIIYWCYNRQKAQSLLKQILHYLHELSKLQILTILLIAIIFAILIMPSFFYDSAFYHYPNIWWNEHYPTVPGLANLEDRFGFNSNCLLLSALFSFSFLFDQPVYTLQAFTFILIFLWSTIQIFKSKFQLANILLFIFYIIFFVMYEFGITDSGTDTIPNIYIFYVLSQVVFKPQSYLNKKLFTIIVLTTMITFKLSSIFFCIILIPIFFHLIKQKEFKRTSIIIGTSALIIGLWMIHNVIVSGYLIYPLYQIDLFDVDWKLPKGTLILQYVHIKTWAEFRFCIASGMSYLLNLPYPSTIATWCDRFSCISLILFLASPIIIIISLIKKININKHIYLFYLITIVNIIFWYLSAPDFRFIEGCILGSIFITLYIILKYLQIDRIRFPKAEIIIFIFVCLTGFSVIRDDLRTIRRIAKSTNQSRTELLLSALIKPTINIHLILWDEAYSNDPNQSHIGKIITYLKNGEKDEDFDQITENRQIGIPFTKYDGEKIQSLKTIEMRSDDVKNGFRTKPEYIILMNENVDQYLTRYHELFNRRIMEIKY